MKKLLFTALFHADAYFIRGNSKSDLGDKQGAITDYDQAIALNPKYANAYNNRSNAKSDLGDTQGAIADLSQAAELFRQQGQMNSYRQVMKLLDQFKSAK